MNVQHLVDAVDRIAPLDQAEPWDNVGLLVGSGDDALPGPVLFTIDLTPAVLDEAISCEASAIVAYHPIIFAPIRALSDRDPHQELVLRAARAGLAVFCPHTALDAAEGGLADWLCEGVAGGVNRVAGAVRALRPHETREPTQELKIVTFVPAEQVERLRDALASAGAGIIGAYRACSFATPGKGSFLGDATTAPTVGQRGRLETVHEVRLEMVCSRAALPGAIETLRELHPYEEPAFDVYELLPRPVRRAGAGRKIALDRPARIDEIARRLKGFLGVSLVKVAGGERKVSRIGLCPGSGASLVDDAIRDGCELFVTGEMKHHEVLDAVRRGLGVILAGHTNTERGYLPRLIEQLRPSLAGVELRVAKADRPPLTPM